MSLRNPCFSLLFPEGCEESCTRSETSVNAAAIKDLELMHILEAMGINKLQNSKCKSVFLQHVSSINIIKYRLAILEDFINNPQMCAMFEELLPMLAELSGNAETWLYDDSTANHIRILEVIELYIDFIEKLNSNFAEPYLRVHSEGLRKLRDAVREIAEGSSFELLKKNLGEIKSGFKSMRSITIGINLDEWLRPVNAVLLSINDRGYKCDYSIGNLLGLKRENNYRGIVPFDIIDKIEEEFQAKLESSDPSKYYEAVRKLKEIFSPPAPKEFQAALDKSLDSIFTCAVKPFTVDVKNYLRENGKFLAGLSAEIPFYLSALKLINTMKAAGLPMCRPVIVEKEDRKCRIRGLYNVNLALKMHLQDPGKDLEKEIILNDAEFGEEGRIYVLTSPNQGGKTTFTAAVGIAHFLFQLGIYVPAYAAVMSPVDVIYTHFPASENLAAFKGRLGEECSRFKDMFNMITPYSLVLLNEPLASTSSQEGLYIAKQVLLGLKLAQCRGVFVTHLHELGENLDVTNSLAEGDSKIESLVTGVISKGDEENNSGNFNKRDYVISRMPPRGISYARDIALKYGLNVEEFGYT